MTRPPPRVCVGAVLRRADGRVLLARRAARRARYAGVWDVPGGHCEPGERPEDALVRELREELAVTALGWELAATFRLAGAGPDGVVLHVYEVPRWAGTPVNAAPAEHRAIAWVAPERACRLARIEPALCAFLRRLPPPAGGRGGDSGGPRST